MSSLCLSNFSLSVKITLCLILFCSMLWIREKKKSLRRRDSFSHNPKIKLFVIMRGRLCVLIRSFYFKHIFSFLFNSFFGCKRCGFSRVFFFLFADYTHFFVQSRTKTLYQSGSIFFSLLLCPSPSLIYSQHFLTTTLDAIFKYFSVNKRIISKYGSLQFQIANGHTIRGSNLNLNALRIQTEWSNKCAIIRYFCFSVEKKKKKRM